MEVAQDDGNLSAGNDEDDEDQCKESKHVIETVLQTRSDMPLNFKNFHYLPNGRDNEEHLDKYSSKGQKSSHYNGRWKLQVPELFFEVRNVNQKKLKKPGEESDGG